MTNTSCAWKHLERRPGSSYQQLIAIGAAYALLVAGCGYDVPPGVQDGGGAGTGAAPAAGLGQTGGDATGIGITPQASGNPLEKPAPLPVPPLSTGPRVVTIHVTNWPAGIKESWAGEAAERMSKAIRALGRSPDGRPLGGQAQSDVNEGWYVGSYGPIDNVRKFADEITFGTVTHVDETNRVITLRLDAAKLP